jgi:hypothetical protein
MTNHVWIRFQPEKAKRCIEEIMEKALKDKIYDAEAAPSWSKEISETVLSGLQSKRRQSSRQTRESF